MIVAEVGLNHLGNIFFAKRYASMLSKVESIDGITFQVRESEYRKKRPHMFFDVSEYEDIFKIIKNNHKLAGAAINSIDMVDFFEGLEADFYKVIRDGVFNRELLSLLSKTEKPILVSTGICTSEDLSALSEYIKEIDGDIRLIYTNRISSRLEDANISKIKELKKYCTKVAYGSHCDSYVDLFLSLPYQPSDLLFYVKDTSMGLNFDDNSWAIDMHEVEDVLNKIRLYNCALGGGES